ncbi:MAG: P-loop NTPase [Chloroflexi bacterium]|nr:P-loop NTPase [Chloroflexota bacterium]
MKLLLVGTYSSALRRLLDDFDDIELVESVALGPPAPRAARDLRPEVVLVAIERPPNWALMTVRDLAAGSPPWTIVALVDRWEEDVIHQAVLAGARDVLPRRSSAMELRTALFRARRAQLEERSGAPEDIPRATGSVVAIFGAKGGVGRTTLATNLALGLATTNSARVTLVDTDVAFGDVALALNIEPTPTLLDTLADGVLDDHDKLRAQLLEGPKDLLVLPAPVAAWPGPTLDPIRITSLLHQLAALNHFVIVDTSVVASDVTAAVLDAAELALLVATPEVPVLYHSRRLLESLHTHDFPVDRVQVVLNRAGSRTDVTTSQARTALDHDLDWLIRNDHAAMRATALGSPVMLTQSRSRVAVDINKIVAYLAGVPSPRSRSHWRFWRR